MQQPVKERIAKAAGGNSANQGSEPSIFARRQEETRYSIGSRTSASEIAGNSGRTDFTHRLEEDMNNFLATSSERLRSCVKRWPRNKQGERDFNEIDVSRA
jgi:hypothetical protein